MTDEISADQTAATNTGVSTSADTSATTNTEVKTDAAASTAGTEGKTLMTEGADENANKDGKDGDKGENGDKEKKDGADKTEAAPETYADFKMPEGLVPDPELMPEFTGVAKELNLSQDQAQKLMDLYSKAQAKAQEQGTQAFAAVQEQWRKSIETDSELGGAKFTETKSNVAKVINQLVPDGAQKKALEQALYVTGAGNNPEIMRLIARAAPFITENSKHSSGKSAGGGGAPTRTADVFYSNDKTNN